jgi:hypothetical protein
MNVEFKMDVKKQNITDNLPALAGGMLDSRQRRALARLGLAAAGAYAAPTLLALRCAVASPLAGNLVVAA